MATKVTFGQPTIRETAATVFERGKHRPIIVTIQPKMIELRAKGMREVYHLSIEQLFIRAVGEACAAARRK